MKAYSIKVTGNVQCVGFRKAVQRAARKLNVSGSVENEEDGSVIIIAQRDEAELQSLIDLINEFKAPAKIEGTKKTAIRVSKTREIFKLKRGSPSEEIEEGFAAYQEQLILLGDKINGFSRSTSKNFDELARRYDNISETLTKLVEESARSREDFKDGRANLNDLTDETIQG